MAKRTPLVDTLFDLKLAGEMLGQNSVARMPS
jgi:hypothetical protein